MTLPPPTVRLLVCGSADRGDDGAPLLAVAHLLPSLDAPTRERLEVRRCPQLDSSDIADVAQDEACLLLDVVIGIAPGTVVTLALPDLGLGRAGISPRSSQPLPINEVLDDAALIRGCLPPGAFVGIGGVWFGFGEVQSRVVRAGLPRFEAAIEAAIRGLIRSPVGA